jgi:hypothetical protein
MSDLATNLHNTASKIIREHSLGHKHVSLETGFRKLYEQAMQDPNLRAFAEREMAAVQGLPHPKPQPNPTLSDRPDTDRTASTDQPTPKDSDPVVTGTS